MTSTHLDFEYLCNNLHSNYLYQDMNVQEKKEEIIEN